MDLVEKLFTEFPEFGKLHLKYLQNPEKRNTEYLKNYYDNVELKLNTLSNESSIVTDKPDKLVDNVNLSEFTLVAKELVYPYQNTEFSYLTGPLLTYFYKTGSFIDVKAYVNKHFDKDTLKRYLFKETVECSKNLLENMLPESKILCCGSRDLDSYLDKYGVALVSQFKVRDDFKDPNITKYEGSPKGEQYEQTSMAMIGYRVDNDKKYYLLQTSWILKPFIVVEEEYLIRSSATVYFVKKLIQTPLPYIEGKYFNLENLDKPDGYFNEM
jgi:hypothetical protein